MKMNLFELICRAFTIADELPILFIVNDAIGGASFSIEFRQCESIMAVRYCTPEGEDFSFVYNTDGIFTRPEKMDSAELVGKLRNFEKETGIDFSSTDWRWDYSTRSLMESKIEKLSNALKFQEEDS